MEEMISREERTFSVLLIAESLGLGTTPEI